MFLEDDLIPLSALQHFLYCERQCALIHVEQLWAENSLTVEGRRLHQKADKGKAQVRAGLRVARALPLRSLRLGLIGKADVVEFHHSSDEATKQRSDEGEASGAASPGIPYPVEYKRGRPKSHDADRVQLCAQALCLEEMLGVAVPAGALFYGRTRRRVEVEFDAALRQLTEDTAGRVHELFTSRRTPPAIRDKKCERCSLRHLCLPGAMSKREPASRYLARMLEASRSGESEGA